MKDSFLHTWPLEQIVTVKSFTENGWPSHLRFARDSAAYMDPDRLPVAPEDHELAGIELSFANRVDAPDNVIAYFNENDTEYFIDGESKWTKTEYWGGYTVTRERVESTDLLEPHFTDYFEHLRSLVESPTNIGNLLPPFEKDGVNIGYRIPDSRNFITTLFLRNQGKLDEVILAIGTIIQLSTKEGLGMEWSHDAEVATLELS